MASNLLVKSCFRDLKSAIVLFSLWLYLIAIVCPGRPFHAAALQVKGKIFHVDVTGWTIYSMTEPHHLTGTWHYHIRVNYRWLILRVSTGNKTSLMRVWIDLCTYNRFVIWDCVLILVVWYRSLWFNRLRVDVFEMN